MSDAVTVGDAAGPVPEGPRPKRPRRRPGTPVADRGAGPPPATRRGGSAAATALVLFAWGESLLACDWARQRFFDPAGRSALVLTLPFFVGSIIAAILAVRARSRQLAAHAASGEGAPGGSLLHGLAVASGLLALTALILALWLGPRMQAAEEDARALRAVRQLEDLAAGLSKYRAAEGRHPDAHGGAALVSALVPRFVAAGMPSRDPWGHELEYRSLSDGRGYLLVSAGRDGVQDLPVADYVDSPGQAGQGNDIVVMNGFFLGAGGLPIDDSPRAWQQPDLLPQGPVPAGPR